MNYPSYMVNNIFFTQDKVKDLIDDYIYRMLEAGYTKEQVLEMFSDRSYISTISRELFQPAFDKYIEENVNIRDLDYIVGILLEHAIKSVDIYKITKKAISNLDKEYIEKRLETIKL